jgi:exonuclease III
MQRTTTAAVETGMLPRLQILRTIWWWMAVQQMMREKKIEVLCIQEAHMDNERQKAVEKLFPKLSVYVTEDPIEPRARNGLAIVVNREQITDPEPPKTQVIVEGRAMSIQLKLHRGTQLSCWGYMPLMR